jgi:hypothetical protein
MDSGTAIKSPPLLGFISAIFEQNSGEHRYLATLVLKEEHDLPQAVGAWTAVFAAAVSLAILKMERFKDQHTGHFLQKNSRIYELPSCNCERQRVSFSSAATAATSASAWSKPSPRETVSSNRTLADVSNINDQPFLGLQMNE